MSILKNHWRKLVVAAFATLWTSCNDDSPSKPVVNDPDSDTQVTSSSSEPESSSSEEDTDTIPKYDDSWERWETLYGIPDPTSSSAANEGVIPECVATVREKHEYPACDGEFCPEYGAMIVEERVCECDDGNTYTYTEYMEKFGVSAMYVANHCVANKTTDKDPADDKPVVEPAEE
ncbi:MAG: hypothetical protein MJZ25_03265 [Fibrobacter sp.]|nr:hypothetical protein [Fibrobacter sp.]